MSILFPSNSVGRVLKTPVASMHSAWSRISIFTIFAVMVMWEHCASVLQFSSVSPKGISDGGLNWPILLVMYVAVFLVDSLYI